MTIIQCYAPTNEEEEEDIKKFYEKLQQTWNNTPKKDIRIVMGDIIGQSTGNKGGEIAMDNTVLERGMKVEKD